MRNKRSIKIKNFFYVAPFDTFYYASLRKILRASGWAINFISSKFLFFVILTGIHCAHNMHAMKLANSDDAKNDVTLKMRHFWSDDYIHNINSVKDLDLKDMRSGVKKEQCLSIHSDALHHLLYLSTIRKNDNRTLFTQKQQNKFDTAEKIKRSVPLFFGINGAVIVGTALFPFTNFAGLAQCSNATVFECLSQVATITTPTVISVAGACAVGFVSLYATGLSPDLSSRKADKVQDEIGHLSHTYATIAKYLIDIYFEHRQKAEWIVNKLDIDELALRAQEKTYKKRAGESLVSPLKEAWHFIKGRKVLAMLTEIEIYIYNKIHCRRIESLENIVREQRAEIERLKQRYEEK